MQNKLRVWRPAPSIGGDQQLSLRAASETVLLGDDACSGGTFWPGTLRTIKKPLRRVLSGGSDSKGCFFGDFLCAMYAEQASRLAPGAVNWWRSTAVFASCF